MIFLATKNGMIEKIYPPPLLVLLLDPGSEIRYPGSGMDENQDPDPGGPKTYGSDGSGSATLLTTPVRLAL